MVSVPFKCLSWAKRVEDESEIKRINPKIDVCFFIFLNDWCSKFEKIPPSVFLSITRMSFGAIHIERFQHLLDLWVMDSLVFEGFSAKKTIENHSESPVTFVMIDF